MGNWYVSKPDNDGERELIDRAVKALEAELATKTCNKKIASKLEDAELARDSEETCNNKQVISKLVASEDCISRQAALEIIKNLYPDMPVVDIMGARRKWLEKYKPYFECENAIEQLPPVTPKQDPCGVSEYDKDHIWYKGCQYISLRRFLEVKSETEQEPKTGRWIYDRTRDWDGECKYECSECGMGSDVDYPYCMRCGAKMVEPQESEGQS